jgi:hypothetical protein
MVGHPVGAGRSRFVTVEEAGAPVTVTVFVFVLALPVYIVAVDIVMGKQLHADEMSLAALLLERQGGFESAWRFTFSVGTASRLALRLFGYVGQLSADMVVVGVGLVK